MFMSKTTQKWLTRVTSLFAKLSWAPPLVARLVTGFLFFDSGWDKLQNLQKFTSNLTKLGIPSPELMAPFVASMEFACGGLLIVGFLSRFAALSMLFNMIVAIVTARLKDVSTLGDFLYLPEVELVALLFWLTVQGAGRVSIDFHVRRRFDQKFKKSDPSAGQRLVA
jgi:putative oxidoreductase